MRTEESILNRLFATKQDARVDSSVRVQHLGMTRCNFPVHLRLFKLLLKTDLVLYLRMQLFVCVAERYENFHARFIRTSRGVQFDFPFVGAANRVANCQT